MIKQTQQGSLQLALDVPTQQIGQQTKWPTIINPQNYNMNIMGHELMACH